MTKATGGHRVSTKRSTQTITVAINGEELASSTRPIVLFESNLPTRYYVPREDVRMDRLVPSETRTTCPFKGIASYWSLPDAPDVAWEYPEPLEAVADIAGALCFYDTVADVRVEGEDPSEPEPAT